MANAILLLIVPVILTIAGIFLYKYTPKKINSIIGYRTDISKRNEITWRASNEYFGKLLTIWGGVLSIVSIVLIVLNLEINLNISIIILASYVVELVIILCCIAKTEKYLKSKFV